MNSFATYDVAFCHRNRCKLRVAKRFQYLKSDVVGSSALIFFRHFPTCSPRQRRIAPRSMS